MALNTRRTAVLGLAGVATLTTAAGAAYFLAERQQMLFYPTVAVLLASVAYLLTQFGGDVSYETLFDRLPDDRILDAGLFLGIASVVALSRGATLGLSSAYYWALPVLTLAFAVRILVGPSRTTLYQIVLFAVVVRAAIWFSAPIVGVDSRVHLALIEFVARSGHLPPTEVSYYHWYPVAHVTAAVVSQLPVVTAKQAFFLTTGLYASLSVAVVYRFAVVALRSVLDGDDLLRAALFAALLLAVAPWHVRRSGILIAQSIGMATIPFVLYAAIRFRARQYVLLFVVFLGLIAFAHNLTPILVSALLFALLASERLVEAVGRYVPDWQMVGVGYGFPLVFATGVLTVQYWIYIEYFDLQVLRLVLLLSLGTSFGGGAGSGSGLTNSNAFTLLDPFLHVGVEQLAFGALLTLFGYVALGERATDRAPVPMAVFLTASTVFLVFSATLLLGDWTRAVRVLPTVVLVVAPTFGFLAARTYASRSSTALLVVALLLSFTVAGAVAATFHTVNPAISPTEEGGAQLYLGDGESAASEHLIRHGSASATYLSSDYLTGTTNYRAAGYRATVPEDASTLGQPILNAPTLVERVEPADDADEDGPTRAEVLAALRDGGQRYYLDSTSAEPSLDPLPQSCSVVYDAGDARLVSC